MPEYIGVNAKTAIIGAGVTGLSAAWELTRRGEENFILLEGETRPGGVIQTLAAGEFLLELGPDAFLAHDPRAGHILPELKLQEEVPPQKEGSTTYIWKQGRALRLPRGWLRMAPESVTEVLTTRLISWPVKARMAREFLWGGKPNGKRAGTTADESVADFLNSRYGREFTEQVAEPILGALFHLRPEEASLRALFPKLWEYAGSKSVSRALWREARARTHPSPGRVGIQGGMARLTDALAAKLRPGQLQCQLRIASIAPHKEGFRLRTSRGEAECERLILAAPAWSAAAMTENFDPELAGALRGIAYAPACLVHLGFEKEPRLTPGHALFVPAAVKTATRAITFVHRKYPHRAPAGAALLRLAMDASKLRDFNEAQIILMARNELGAIFGVKDEPCLSHVQRWHRAAPLLQAGHLERTREVLQRAEKYSNLALACNGVHGASVAACLQAGRMAAQKDHAQRHSTAEGRDLTGFSAR